MSKRLAEKGITDELQELETEAIGVKARAMWIRKRVRDIKKASKLLGLSIGVVQRRKSRRAKK